MDEVIDINTAKEQLKRINQELTVKHMLIGGLAVQQYYKARGTKDIDLVCDSDTAKQLIQSLYPSKDYKVAEINDDEYRPSYEITHKINKSKIVFFGPKILERNSYEAIAWEKLHHGSQPFKYKNEELNNILIPRIETLAFTKLLSFVGRVQDNREKGQNDLIDFIELTNDDNFKLNILINHIRESRTAGYFQSRLDEISEYDDSIWDSNLFVDFLKIISPIIRGEGTKGDVFDDNYSKLYKVENSISFYQTVANKYDERNTNFVFDTHRQVIKKINKKKSMQNSTDVLDIGAGTGRLIATQFSDDKSIRWSCIEPCKGMAKLFKQSMKNSKIEYEIHDCSVYHLNEKIKSKTYDIVIMSLLLSSLERDPDFSNIAKLLKPGGNIIIADFHQSNPYYDFTISAKKIALYTRKVSMIEVIQGCLDSKLALKSLDSIENRTNYGKTFIMEFQKIS